MEKNTLKTYQDDMFYYAHMQMLQGNQGKFVYYELAVDHPLYLSTSIDPTQRGVECAGDEHPTKLFTIYVTLADVCMVFYTDGCTQWVEFEDCGGQGGGGGLNPVNNPPMVVTIPTIPPLNFPGMMPALIPINSPISLPSIPSPTPWLPWLSYPILGGGDTGGIGSGDLPIDPGSSSNTNPLGNIEYNGLIIETDFYSPKNGGSIISIDDNTLKTVKAIIDDPDYRIIIGAYLGTNTKLTIKFETNGNGEFDPITNSIRINPDLITREGKIGVAKTMIHEGLHAMLLKPTFEIETQLGVVEGMFLGDTPPTPYNPNMIHHNVMAFDYRNTAVKILRRFDKGVLGKKDPNVGDDHYLGLFIISLRKGLHPVTKKYDYITIKYWNGLSVTKRKELADKRNALIDIYTR
jgi:hypothetical protein